MLFEKDGRQLEVHDRAHIDCLRAKGWVQVVEKQAAPKEVKANARKNPRTSE